MRQSLKVIGWLWCLKMRAEFIEDLKDYKQGDTLELKAKDFHHLINVARLNIGEAIIFLDGYGLKSLATTLEITKKIIIFKLETMEQVERSYQVDLVLTLNKKDATDLMLKISSELGIRKIYLTYSKYSQREKINFERMKRVMIESIKQSNNAYLPEVVGPKEFSEINYSSYKNIFCFSLRQQKNKAASIALGQGEFLIVLGPEGGLSDEEELLLADYKTKYINFPTPIMRSPTALASAFGWLIGMSN